MDSEPRIDIFMIWKLKPERKTAARAECRLQVD